MNKKQEGTLFALLLIDVVISTILVMLIIISYVQPINSESPEFLVIDKEIFYLYEQNDTLIYLGTVDSVCNTNYEGFCETLIGYG